MFLTYFESGRVAMFRDPDLGIGVPGVTFVLVRMEVDYMKELRWPGNLEVGTGVAEFGRSSFKVSQAIFRDGVCAAIGRATLVCMDIKTRKATPLPEAAIERLSQWKYARHDERVTRVKPAARACARPARRARRVTLIWHDSREFGFTS